MPCYTEARNSMHEDAMSFAQGHALLIGVGSYRDHPAMDVPATARDAAAVAAALRDPRACGYPGEQVSLLSGGAATRAAILAALDDLAGLDADATAFLFYSGHGALGADGNYYLTSYDTAIAGGRVAAGTGISEQELLARLRAISAKRLLIVLNACHAGAVSPVLGPAEQPLAEAQIPEKTAAALLATGAGRVIITACREGQYSFVGGGELTLFGQALVEGLQGRGDYVANRHGFISAFDLYSHLYDTLQARVPRLVDADVRARYGGAQEPELTVLKGVGPFAVALYRGASALGEFGAPAKPEVDAGLREVEQARSRRLLEQILAGATIASRQSGGVNFGVGNTIGAIGDIVAGDKIAGDKIAGDKITVGGVTNSSGIAIGRGARASGAAEPSAGDAERLFRAIYARIEARQPDPAVEKDEIRAKVQQIEREARAGARANQGKLGRWLRELDGMAPEVFDATAACLASPLAGFDEAVRAVAARANAER